MPRRQHRVFFLGDQNGLRRFLRRRADVPKQLGHAFDAGEDWARADLLREKFFFDDVRARGERHFFREDGGDGRGIVGEVVQPPPGLGQVRQKIGGVVAHAHGRERNPVIRVHGLNKFGDAGRVGAAVREQDDVLNCRIVFRKFF